MRRAGHRLVLLDDLSAGHREAALGAALVEVDILDVAPLRSAIRQHGVTAVMHFAGRLSVAESIRDPAGYYRANLDGTLSVLDAMVREGIETFVFSSSCAVYGEPIDTPISETHPTRPVNPYGESKLAVERALPHFERAHGIRAISLRYFNAAGADPDRELGEDHNPEDHLIPRAIDAARGGGVLQVFGTDYQTPDGTCLRDYVHVCDLAEAHVLALQALEAGAPSAVYNVGVGRPYSVLEVIAGVERATGMRVPWVTARRRPGDPGVLFASSDCIRRELGWRPRYDSLDAVIETAWDWHRTHPRGFATAPVLR